MWWIRSRLFNSIAEWEVTAQCRIQTWSVGAMSSHCIASLLVFTGAGFVPLFLSFYFIFFPSFSLLISEFNMVVGRIMEVWACEIWIQRRRWQGFSALIFFAETGFLGIESLMSYSTIMCGFYPDPSSTYSRTCYRWLEQRWRSCMLVEISSDKGLPI
jgi:hypothetical protein